MKRQSAAGISGTGDRTGNAPADLSPATGAVLSTSSASLAGANDNQLPVPGYRRTATGWMCLRRAGVWMMAGSIIFGMLYLVYFGSPIAFLLGLGAFALLAEGSFRAKDLREEPRFLPTSADTAEGCAW